MNTLVVRIIWAALTLSQLAYGAIFVILPATKSSGGAPLPLWIPAIGTALVSLFIHTTRLSYLNLQTLYAKESPQLATNRVFVLYVICWALNESVALFGFVATFLGDHQLSTFAPYLAAGVALNLLMFPKVDRHIREAEARRAASGEQG